MELRHLRYFDALAEALNFTRAAQRLHVTQSTLSHQIRQLEDELGYPLFDRTTKKVAMTEAGELLREFPVSPEALAELKVGATIGAATFAVGELVDVTGTTKGRGFSGVIRRHHFSSNRASHGNSRSHNTPGSIGMAQDPGRVFPGKRMAGQHGNATRTVQTLTVIRVDAERGLLLVKGSVPGADGGHIIVRPSVKTPAKKGG